MGGEAIGIFRVVIIKAARRLQFGDGERPVAEHRHGQFAAGDERLRKQAVEMLPGSFGIAAYGRAVIALLRHDRDTDRRPFVDRRSEEHTSELQSLMRISYAVFCLNTTTTPT